MGLIPADMDGEFAEAKGFVPGSGSGYLPDGIYTGRVANAEVRPSKLAWRDAELALKLTVEDTTSPEHGKSQHYDTEVAPLRLKATGELSPGKLGFLKGQLEALGYTGKLSDLESQIDSVRGALVQFDVTTEDQVNGDGSTKLNPKTQKPYTRTEVKLLALIESGGPFGGSTVQAGGIVGLNAATPAPAPQVVGQPATPPVSQQAPAQQAQPASPPPAGNDNLNVVV